jgi:hypothetical protein
MKTRINNVKNVKHYSNCIGTSLFIMGLTDNDFFVDATVEAINNALHCDYNLELAKTPKPETGNMLLIRYRSNSNRLWHSGIVVKTKPTVQIFHRPGMIFNPRYETLKSVLSMYKFDSEIEYYKLRRK